MVNLADVQYQVFAHFPPFSFFFADNNSRTPVSLQKGYIYTCKHHCMLKKKGVKITERQYQLLKMFENQGSVQRVCTVSTSQAKLSHGLGITRQALHTHLKSLKEEGLLRTGRGFIDLTEKALEFLETKTGEAYIVIRTDPQKRREVFDQVSQLKFRKICRTTGDADIIITVERKDLDNAIGEIQRMEGIQETTRHILLECKWE